MINFSKCHDSVFSLTNWARHQEIEASTILREHDLRTPHSATAGIDVHPVPSALCTVAGGVPVLVIFHGSIKKSWKLGGLSPQKYRFICSFHMKFQLQVRQMSSGLHWSFSPFKQSISQPVCPPYSPHISAPQMYMAGFYFLLSIPCFAVWHGSPNGSPNGRGWNRQIFPIFWNSLDSFSPPTKNNHCQHALIHEI